ncbi:MAG TPA: hypothetical protein VJ890_13915 [Vineibacter sp.]|nr:hypothetical protein [Vineibacter sp.]
MPLKSLFFAGNARLEACLVKDAAHVVLGDSGQHVLLIQDALRAIDGLTISPEEVKGRRYGTSTVAAVLAYKRKRKIINRSYQSAEDSIVGKMTIKSLDDELVQLQTRNATSRPASPSAFCTNNMPPKLWPRHGDDEPTRRVMEGLLDTGRGDDEPTSRVMAGALKI